MNLYKKLDNISGVVLFGSSYLNYMDIKINMLLWVVWVAFNQRCYAQNHRCNGPSSWIWYHIWRLKVCPEWIPFLHFITNKNNFLSFLASICSLLATNLSERTWTHGIALNLNPKSITILCLKSWRQNKWCILLRNYRLIYFPLEYIMWLIKVLGSYAKISNWKTM